MSDTKNNLKDYVDNERNWKMKYFAAKNELQNLRLFTDQLRESQKKELNSLETQLQAINRVNNDLRKRCEGSSRILSSKAVSHIERSRLREQEEVLQEEREELKRHEAQNRYKLQAMKARLEVIESENAEGRKIIALLREKAVQDSDLITKLKTYITEETAVQEIILLKRMLEQHSVITQATSRSDSESFYSK